MTFPRVSRRQQWYADQQPGVVLYPSGEEQEQLRPPQCPECQQSCSRGSSQAWTWSSLDQHLRGFHNIIEYEGGTKLGKSLNELDRTYGIYKPTMTSTPIWIRHPGVAKLPPEVLSIPLPSEKETDIGESSQVTYVAPLAWLGGPDPEDS